MIICQDKILAEEHFIFLLNVGKLRFIPYMYAFSITFLLLVCSKKSYSALPLIFFQLAE